MISLIDAVGIVLDLAKENVLTEEQALDNELVDERNRQLEACNTVEDFAVNHIADM